MQRENTRNRNKRGKHQEGVADPGTDVGEVDAEEAENGKWMSTAGGMKGV